MNTIEAIERRHSVRSYKDLPIETEILDKLDELIKRCNEVSGLHFQLVRNEPKAFDSTLARYGSFKNVSNYIALIGKKSKHLDELCGYYGEQIVLEATKLGLNSCWVALTYKKIPSAFIIDKDEKLTVVIAIGYGENEGSIHKSKDAKDISNIDDNSPEWFKEGVRCALLAPTAINQQKFYLERIGDKVKATASFGPHSKMDLGIVKYHFEVGAKKDYSVWMVDDISQNALDMMDSSMKNYKKGKVSEPIDLSDFEGKK